MLAIAALVPRRSRATGFAMDREVFRANDSLPYANLWCPNLARARASADMRSAVQLARPPFPPFPFLQGDRLMAPVAAHARAEWPVNLFHAASLSFGCGAGAG